MDLKQPINAKFEFNNANALNPNYAKPLFLRMLIYKDMKEYELGIADAKEILEIYRLKLDPGLK